MIHWIAVIAIVFAFTYDKEAEAAQASVSLLHGDGYATSQPSKHTLRIDALAVKDWGMVYGRADVVSIDNDNSNTFTRGIAHYRHGVHLAGQLQNQKNISQTSIGIGYSSFNKSYSWFVDLYRMSSNYYGSSDHIFSYGSVKLTDTIKIQGFLEYTKPDNQYNEVVFSQASILYGLTSDLWLGIEHQRYFNKNGIKGLDESVNQLMLKWEF